MLENYAEYTEGQHKFIHDYRNEIQRHTQGPATHTHNLNNKKISNLTFAIVREERKANNIQATLKALILLLSLGTMCVWGVMVSCGGQGTALWIWFFLSTLMWMPGITLRLPDLPIKCLSPPSFLNCRHDHLQGVRFTWVGVWGGGGCP